MCLPGNRRFAFVKIKSYVGANRLHENAKTVAGELMKYKEGLQFFNSQKVWCFNRLYYHIFLILIYSKSIPLIGPFLPFLMKKAKMIRVKLINSFKLY